MDKEKKLVSVYQLAKAFEKMYKGLNKEQLRVFEEELLKMYPSEESKVLLFPDYEDGENSMGMSIYVTNPLAANAVKKMDFSKLMFEYLIKADITRFTALDSCINLMESRGGESYEVDLIPAAYDEDIEEYNIHFRITKAYVKEEVLAS